ncbi:MAG: hypothetical protein OXI95_14540 [bacterium]|nr:hypothetical protein [bacterium]
MPAYKNLTMALGASALFLGLGACGGGGGGLKSAIIDEATMATATAFSTAIETAKATGADGTFDDMPYMVAPSVEATNDGTMVTIEVTETGTPQGGSARAGEFSMQENRPAPIAGWTGARFRRDDANEHLIVYSDVGVPEAVAFTPANLNRLHEVSGMTGDMIPASGLVVQDAWFPVIRSTSLAAASPRGSVTYATTGMGADEGLAFTGTFSDAPGEYSCSGSSCRVTLDDRGAPTATGGSWTFAPAEDAMVSIPDYDYVYFGWWLNETDDAHGFQTFADAAGLPAGAGNVEAAMEGSATYRGAAAGVWATLDVAGGQITRARSGEFTAQAELTANFFATQDAGVVNGEITSFRDGSGRSLAGWRVILDSAQLTVGAASFAGATRGALGSASSGTGSWEGQFHGSDGAETNAQPSHVTGRFDLHFPGAHIAGAFGGSKQ